LRQYITATTADRGGGDKTQVTVTDSQGRDVTLDLPLEKIVLFDNDSINTYVAIGGLEFFDKVVGLGGTLKESNATLWDLYCKKVPGFSDIPQLGGFYEGTVSSEKVLALKPDLVVIPNYVKLLNYPADEFIEYLEYSNVPYIFLGYYNDSFDEGVYENNTRTIGTILQNEERAEEIIEFNDREKEKVLGVLHDGGDKPTVFLEILMDPSSGTYMTTVVGEPEIAYGGLYNMGRDNSMLAGTGYGFLSMEYIMSKDPDLILLCASGYYYPPLGEVFGFDVNPTQEQLENTAKEYLGRTGWSSLTAVKEGRVHFIDANFRNGVECFVSLQYVAMWGYPDVFPDLDPKSALEEFYDRFMPFEISGNWAYTPALSQ
jgi:iron complex transport system substrate-binding protein